MNHKFYNPSNWTSGVTTWSQFDIVWQDKKETEIIADLKEYIAKSSKFNINSPDALFDNGSGTLLMLACFLGKTTVVEFLLDDFKDSIDLTCKNEKIKTHWKLPLIKKHQP